MSNVLEPIFCGLAEVLEPLESSFADSEGFELFLLRYGWRADVGPGDLNAINNAFALAPLITTLIDDLDELTGGITQDRLEASMRLLQSAKNAIKRISALSGTSGAELIAPLNQALFWNELAENLFADLAVIYFEQRQPVMFAILHLSGVIRFERQIPVGANRVPFTRSILDWEQLGKVFTAPGDAFADLYHWDDSAADLDHSALLRAAERSMLAFGLPAAVQPPRAQLTAALLRPASILAHGINELEMPIVDGISTVEQAYWKIGAVIVPIPDPVGSAGEPTGFAIRPLLQGQLATRIVLGHSVGLTLSGAFDADRALTALIQPSGASLIGDPESNQIAALMELAGRPKEPWLLIGEREGSRLELGGFVSSLGMEGTVTAPEVRIRAGTAEGANGGLKFTLMLGESDSFIRNMVGQEQIVIDFSGLLTWSSIDGFSFEGQAGLELALALHLALGAIEIDTLYIGVRASTYDGRAGAKADLGVGITGNLGPITAVVENIGVSVTFAPVAAGEAGTFGNLDMGFGFKPPNGVGLSIDAGVVKGGGYLFLDYDKGEYAGALEISIADIVTVKAIGLITTKMPDGSDGFSLLVIISAEFTPIQLGFGFTLNSVGGLLGLNRTMRLEALAEGVRSGAVDSVMFPTNIIANAPRIISDLKSFFPSQEGRFLIGPMAKLGWGTPTLVTLSLGIIIEMPPGNIAIVGVLKVALPDEDAALIVLQVNFIGNIEVDKSRLWFFANLYDSRVLFITLDGEMGLLVAWGHDANFVVSVGGFHPAFDPPALPFPSPARIALTILNTSFARIRMEGYFAVTSNTVQFGAAVEIYFGLSAFNIEGHITFDALFQFSPFYFIITLSASFSVKVFGVGLYSIRMRGELEGTSPWHIEGEGSISLLFWDIDVPFSHTWGDGAETVLPPVSVIPLLAAEIAKDSNWTAIVPSASKLLVSLRQLDEAGGLILHPVGSLRFSQRVIPLDLKLKKFGAQRPDDADRLRLRVSDASLEKKADLSESFATAQFKDVPNAQKLALPAFEKQDAGLEFSVAGAATRVGRALRRTVRFEVEIVDSSLRGRKRLGLIGLFNALFSHLLAGNAAANAKISARREQLIKPQVLEIAVTGDVFVIANMRDNAIAASTIRFTSKAKALEVLQLEVANAPGQMAEMHVIPACEARMTI